MRPTVFTPVDELTRRRLLTGAGAAGLLIAAGRGVGPAAGAEPEDGAFPVTIEHQYGGTEIREEPRRVVSVGLTEQDAILALGVKPVAVTEWFGEQPYATWPWATDELGGAEPAVLRGDLNFERVAGLRPDLILAIYSAITEDDYHTLSQIAPTVAPPAGYADYLGPPWQEATRVIGRALGQPARAEQLVAEVESLIAHAREEHPEFEGAAVVFAVNGGDGSYYLHGQESAPVRAMRALGFRLPTQIPKPAANEPYTQISGEQIDLLDLADVLVWVLNSGAEREGFANDPLYQGLDVVKEGRDIFLAIPEPLAGATGFNSVLSIPFLLDGLVPMLAAAVDGDPATEVIS
ncbi:MAG: iron-siderophore ABC transporter substrate-binding protein [Egibacteraceae bacterium]